MDFISERTVISILSDTIVKSSVCLYNSIKYIYSVAEDDFYNCNIKDILKVVFNNIKDTECLKRYGLHINQDNCKEMNSPEYNKVLPLIVYSFAIRVPLLKRIKVNNKTLSDNQIKAIYAELMSKGAENYLNTIPETFDDYRKICKSKCEIPDYSSDWYKAFIFTKVPELAEINNKNIFLLGVIEVLFTVFESYLREMLKNQIESFETI